MAYLVLVRHGVSEWNTLGKWTGWTDTSLTEAGREEARRAAEGLRDLTLHKAYVSDLARAQQTLEEIKHALSHTELETVVAPEIKERHYGIYTGKNKWEAKETLGDEEFTNVRRAWNHPIPEGESLKQVHDRVVPHYEQHILTDLKAGKNVIIAGHGNSLRALMKHLEGIADDDIANHEIGTGEVHMYEIDENGTVIGKEIRVKNEKKV